jgi:para-nitrobenzyl esterase
MKSRNSIALLSGALALAAVTAAFAGQQAPSLGHAHELVINLAPKSAAKLTVTSPAFKDGADIPYENTQYRGDIFPGLTWSKGPVGTKSYAVVVQGASLTNPGAASSIHLTLFNVPASVTTLKAGMTAPPAGATYGENIHGINQYYAGPHTHGSNKGGYQYEVLALDSVLDLPPATGFEQMVDGMTGHVLAGGSLLGLSAKDPEATDAPLRSVPTKIESGLISGVQGRDRGVLVYKGVPYAAPPVGDLRFRAPQPAIAWEGVRKADEFGKICPQSGGPGGGNRDNMSEDCLTANVWTAAAYPGENRPVYVWIYGGGFSGGTGSSAEFDGEALAKKGIVVVTFNYRLGALGFLATPELSKEGGHNASGNFGLLDDLALLQWVHKNITAFGGDPNRVTLGGQSAGAGSVGFLAMSPLAKGLFIRAIAESHTRSLRDTELRYLATSYRQLKAAEEQGLKWQEAHGAHSIAELRVMPWDKLLASMADSDQSIETGSNQKPPLFRPVVDGWVVPKGFSQTFASHSQNDVEFLAGNNRDESGAVPEDSFARRRAAESQTRGGGPGDGPGAGGPGGAAGPGGGGPGGQGGPGGGGGQAGGGGGGNLTEASREAAAQRKFGPLADEYLKEYPASSDEEAGLVNNESVRDNNRISIYLWGTDWKPGTDKPVYTYYWTHRPTGSRGGASHTSEIIFAFNNLSLRNNPWTDEDRKVADTVSSYWANYIATGNPNGPGLPVWPAFDAKSQTVMELGDHFGPIPVATPEHLAFWKKFFKTQPAW